jgi:hypothetical protein
LGNPWLSSVKGDFSFEAKHKNSLVPSQSFDDIKAHLLNETIKVIERKLKYQLE